jgi:hypothetical protein
LLHISGLQAFDAGVVILVEEVDPVTYKTADVDVHNPWRSAEVGNILQRLRKA